MRQKIKEFIINFGYERAIATKLSKDLLDHKFYSFTIEDTLFNIEKLSDNDYGYDEIITRKFIDEFTKFVEENDIDFYLVQMIYLDKIIEYYGWDGILEYWNIWHKPFANHGKYLCIKKDGKITGYCNSSSIGQVHAQVLEDYLKHNGDLE